MIEITTYEQFKELINSPTPIIVKFGAPWCGPCKSIEPNLEQVAGDGYAVYKVNIDSIPEAAEDFRVMGVPTTAGFIGGEIKEKKTGVLTTEQIKALIN